MQFWWDCTLFKAHRAYPFRCIFVAKLFQHISAEYIFQIVLTISLEMKALILWLGSNLDTFYKLRLNILVTRFLMAFGNCNQHGDATDMAAEVLTFLCNDFRDLWATFFEFRNEVRTNTIQCMSHYCFRLVQRHNLNVN